MKWTPEKSFRIRVLLVRAFFAIFFLAVVGRGFWLQVLDREQTVARARRQYQRVVPLTPRRGAIYDRNGEELARSIAVDSLYAEPWRITDAEATVRSLAKELKLSPASLKKSLVGKRRFVWIKRQLQPRESDQVRELKLPGIGFTKEHQRFYPNAELAAHVLGFTGLDPRGLEGLEHRYNNILLGHEGFLVTARDARGQGLGTSHIVVKGGSDGHSLYLTLDKNLQYIAEKELAAGLEKAGAPAGSALVLDPRTGEILAMASRPTYNPNAFGRFPAGHRRNRTVCDEFEPGSTLKPFVVAAAMNAGLVSANQNIFCENGRYRVGGITIHDHHPHGDLTVAEVVKVSSNIGVAKIGKMLERQRLYDALQSFGFGQQTGIDFPGEVTGRLRNPARWFESDLAVISFGQGMTVTPLQLALATCVLANGGKLVHADLVRKVVNDHGQVVEDRRPRVVRRVISEAVANQIRDMMRDVTGTGGTGTLAAVPGFTVAGKTGTAQKVDPVTGGYSADKRIASFVGFVPVENPRLVILVVIDEPHKVVYGGLVAAPVFSRIASQSLRYLGVAPSQATPSPVLPPMPAVAPAGPITVVETSASLTQNEEGMPLMPDFSGMSTRQVLQAMERLGLNIRIKGSGRVVEQSPLPGRPIQFGDEIWVRMMPPS